MRTSSGASLQQSHIVTDQSPYITCTNPLDQRQGHAQLCNAPLFIGLYSSLLCIVRDVEGVLIYAEPSCYCNQVQSQRLVQQHTSIPSAGLCCDLCVQYLTLVHMLQDQADNLGISLFLNQCIPFALPTVTEYICICGNRYMV